MLTSLKTSKAVEIWCRFRHPLTVNNLVQLQPPISVYCCLLYKPFDIAFYDILHKTVKFSKARCLFVYILVNLNGKNKKVWLTSTRALTGTKVSFGAIKMSGGRAWNGKHFVVRKSRKRVIIGRNWFGVDFAMLMSVSSLTKYKTNHVKILMYCPEYLNEVIIAL